MPPKSNSAPHLVAERRFLGKVAARALAQVRGDVRRAAAPQEGIPVEPLAQPAGARGDDEGVALRREHARGV